MPWAIYIIRCKDKTLYTGITTGLERRIKAHNSGNGCRYTSCRFPVRLVHFEYCLTRAEALKRERYIKGLPRKKKLGLAKNNRKEINEKRSILSAT